MAKLIRDSRVLSPGVTWLVTSGLQISASNNNVMLSHLYGFVMPLVARKTIWSICLYCLIFIHNYLFVLNQNTTFLVVLWTKAQWYIYDHQVSEPQASPSSPKLPTITLAPPCKVRGQGTLGSTVTTAQFTRKYTQFMFCIPSRSAKAFTLQNPDTIPMYVRPWVEKGSRLISVLLWQVN